MKEDEENMKEKENTAKRSQKTSGILGSNYNWWLNPKDDKYDEVYKELKE